MAPETARVEDNRLVGCNVGRSIAMPHVSMDEARFDVPTLRLHRPQEARNHLFKQGRQQILHLIGLRTSGLLFKSKHPLHALYIKLFPGVCPAIILRQASIMRCHMEPKLWLTQSLKRFYHLEMHVGALQVHLGQLQSELFHIWQFLVHLMKVLEKEVDIWVGNKCAPPHGSWGKVIHDGVDGLRRLIFSFHHAIRIAACRNLRRLNRLAPLKTSNLIIFEVE
jgi:hypothetical protein